MKVGNFILIVLFIILFGTSLRAESFYIAPFVNEGDRDGDWVGAGFHENISAALLSSGCQVVSAQDVKIACSYLGVYNETAISKENIRKVADILNVDKTLCVRFRVSAGRIFISADLFSRGGQGDRKISFDDSAENIFQMQDSLAAGIRKDKPFEYVSPKPVYIKVRKKKTSYTYRKVNPYLKPYEWYARGLALKKKNPSQSMDYLIQTLRYDPEHVRALCTAADIAHTEQGLTDGALGFLLRADRILVRRGESTVPSYANLMVKIADIYEDKKDPARAQIYLSRGLEVWKKHRKGRGDDYAAFLYEVASIYSRIGWVNTEVDFLSMAKEAVEKDGNTHSVRYAWLMKYMGDFYAGAGSRAEAEPFYFTVESVLRERGLDSTAEYADCKYQRGLLYAERGEKVKADAELRNAQRIYAGVWQYEKAKAAQKEAELLFKKTVRD